MKIQFNGAAQDVTGSQYLLEINGQRLLIDCGMYQGPQAYERNVQFQYDPHTLDAVILTHAHIDHSGNLPTLVKNGYRGPIYTTPATADLTDLMLRDSGKIQEEDAEERNSRHKQASEREYLALYTAQDAAAVKEHFKPVPYGQPFKPVRGVTATLCDAGHILGSASIRLEIQEKGRKPYAIWFSGDIGRMKLPLLHDPTLPHDIQYLVMEATYGDTVHADPDRAYNLLREVTAKTIQRGGRVIIPAFAVGRTQELVYDFNRMMTAGEIPHVPVFVDSPLAVNATEVFQEHPELFDAETAQFIREHRHPALNFKELVYVESREQSRQINDFEKPCIIIAASGMAENGRIVHHLVHGVGDARNTIVIVGWQAPGTTGRALVDGAERVKFFDDDFDVRASVVNISGFSAHAGQDMLLDYALASRTTLEKVILVHADPEVAQAFAGLLRQKGIREVVCPDLHETMDV